MLTFQKGRKRELFKGKIFLRMNRIMMSGSSRLPRKLILIKINNRNTIPSLARVSLKVAQTMHPSISASIKAT